jgi:simple sugar transport system permease protein
MNPATLTVLVMVLSGALAGLAGGTEVLGTQFRATQTFAGDIGFDAIAVSLLGRSTPIGTMLAAFLFGILQAGGQRMQLDSGVPIDLILVLRALIVLFIAAPLLIKWIWRIKPEGEDVRLSFKTSVG